MSNFKHKIDSFKQELTITKNKEEYPRVKDQYDLAKDTLLGHQKNDYNTHKEPLTMFETVNFVYNKFKTSIDRHLEDKQVEIDISDELGNYLQDLLSDYDLKEEDLAKVASMMSEDVVSLAKKLVNELITKAYNSVTIADSAYTSAVKPHKVKK